MRLLLLVLALALAPLAARAQTTAVTTTRAVPVPCQGGTGAPVTSVATTVTEVCAGTTGQRSYFRISETGGAAATTPNIVCTIDAALTPSGTTYSYALYGPGTWFDTTGMLTVPTAPIMCISLTGSAIAITADAYQPGSQP